MRTGGVRWSRLEQIGERTGEKEEADGKAQTEMEEREQRQELTK